MPNPISPLRLIHPSRSSAALIAALLILAACKRDNRGIASAQDSAGAKSATASAAVDSGSLPAEIDMPEEVRTATRPAGRADSLPDFLDTFEHNARGFKDFVDPLGWGQPKNKPRKCKNPTACNNVNSARLVIAASAGAKDVSVDDVPMTGFVVGRIFNPSGYDDATTEIPAKPSDRRPSEYYIVAQYSTSPKARPPFLVAIVNYEKDGTVSKDLVLKTAEKEYHPCFHAKKDKSYGDFRDCSDEPVIGPATVTPKPLVQSVSETAPAWFSCAEGCCTAEFPPLSKMLPANVLHPARRMNRSNAKTS